MSISIDSSLWRLRGSDEVRTLIHITQISTGLTVGRMRNSFPSTEALAAMSEADFNELCRVSFHSTDIRNL